MNICEEPEKPKSLWKSVQREEAVGAVGGQGEWGDRFVKEESVNSSVHG